MEPNNTDTYMRKSNKQRFGVFYVSHGKWTGPYAGMSFTKHMLSRQPIKGDVSWIKNYVLKSRIQLRPVKA